MKRIITLSLFLSICIVARSQTGVVYTVAGCPACTTTSVDGVPATNAWLNNTAGIAADSHGNIYIADAANNRVRMVSATTNDVSTVAGITSAAFSGDGGPASTAQINAPQGIFIDAADNIYIADAGNNRVRKVDGVTHTINTVAGGGSSTADGVAATTASITPFAVYVDASGNIYTGGSNKVRQISATGIITTVAGNGSATNSGDGGLALSAGIQGPVRGITMDRTGNMYIVPASGDRVRKIDAGSGIITTIAGGGTCTADGVPATVSSLNSVYSCVADSLGNIIIADFGRRLIRQVDAGSGIIHTIAGGGTATADGVPATATSMQPYMLYLNRTGNNVYYSNDGNMVRRVTYFADAWAGLATDSFSVSVNRLCGGPSLTITTNSASIPSMSVQTWFGDGTSTTSSFTATCATNGVVTQNHTYAYSGTYTIKHVLYDGTLAVDSIQYPYEHSLCNDIYVRYYFDVNGNCVKDTTEALLNVPELTEVDSNGVIIDTISATSGFYYKAYGLPGDIYQFKPILGSSLGLVVSCPVSGVISDTLQSLIYNVTTNDFAVNCDSVATYDLEVFSTVLRSTTWGQWAKIYVRNLSCNPVDANVTLVYSPKYAGPTAPYPLTATTSGNTVSWNVNSLSSTTTPANAMLACTLNIAGSTYLTLGDTVQTQVSITPTAGDVNTANNYQFVVDTVRASWDPNEMWVSPSGCTSPGTKTLRYTINFENTGSDTAFNIYVLDTLSNSVDPKTIRILMASNSMNTSLISAGGRNVLKLDFPGINLLDSSHHNLCDGAVIFNIDLKDGLIAGTQVANRAGIYFDTNPVVMTNTVDNVTGCTAESVVSLAKGSTVSIYPNPADNELIIRQDGTMFTTASITNTLGQQITVQKLGGTYTKVNISSLPPGVYCITFTDNNGGTMVRKFVKM
jgi:Secretion system C-terminal sorting domain